MPAVLLNVKLQGFLGLSGVQRALDREPIALDLPDDVTADALIECLAERCGAAFRRKAIGRDGRIRPGLRIFVDDELVGAGTSLRDALRPGSRVAVILLMAQTIGG